jgi:hypothetical protein
MSIQPTILHVTLDQMRAMNPRIVKQAPKQPPQLDQSKWPRWARKLAEHAQPTDTGLGDTLHGLLKRVGGDQYKRLRRAIRWPCRCSQRQATLNARYPLK